MHKNTKYKVDPKRLRECYHDILHCQCLLTDSPRRMSLQLQWPAHSCCYDIGVPDWWWGLEEVRPASLPASLHPDLVRDGHDEHHLPAGPGQGQEEEDRGRAGGDHQGDRGQSHEVRAGEPHHEQPGPAVPRHQQGPQHQQSDQQGQQSASDSGGGSFQVRQILSERLRFCVVLQAAGYQNFECEEQKINGQV